MIEMTTRKVALGLLAFSLLALLIGVFNAVRLNHEREQTRVAESDASPSVAALLNKKNHLALVELSGIITMDSNSDNGLFQNESNAMSVRKALDSAAKNDSVKGVLLRINSPGGTVGMSQELNAAVKRVREKKPVVVSMGDLTASGGYYTACAADRIFANPGTLTASIGVIISTMNFSGLMNDKLGIQAVTIKSGRFKDLLSPYRKPNPDEVALIQKLINESYQDFLGAVLEGRTSGLDPAAKSARAAKIKAIADGRIVTGEQAKAAGLVDEIGDLEAAYTALDKIVKDRFHLGGKDRLPLESETKSFKLMDFLGIKSESRSGTSVTPVEQVAQMLPPSMRYRNQPLWIME